MDIESRDLTARREFLRWIPVIGLAISFYSAVFATFILYPWHLELSKEFLDMKSMCI
jgi:hypothetical protein